MDTTRPGITKSSVIASYWKRAIIVLIASYEHYFYCLQRSCGKVMFLYQSVILFTGAGSLSRGVSVQGGLCPGWSLCRGSLYRGSLCRESFCLGGSLSRVGLCPWGLCPGRYLSGFSVSVRPPSHTVTCRQYAVYWNALLCQ